MFADGKVTVSTLLEILADKQARAAFLRYVPLVSTLLEILDGLLRVDTAVRWHNVSTLLEILVLPPSQRGGQTGREVSTLLEILVVVLRRLSRGPAPVEVSTLLEILGLVCLVVVGF